MKEAKLDRVAFAVIKTLTESPHRKLNVSVLAKRANVSRAWIYKYMGRTPTEIALTSIDALAPMITETGTPRRRLLSPRKWLRNLLRSFNRTLIEATEFPELYRFYFQSLLTKNPFRERIQFHEAAYFETTVLPQIREAFGFAPSEARAFGEMIFSMRMGLVLHWISRESHPPRARQKLIQTVRKTIER